MFDTGLVDMSVRRVKSLRAILVELTVNECWALLACFQMELVVTGILACK